MQRLLSLMIVVVLLSSCGEAMFFRDIRLDAPNAQTNLDQIIASTALQPGYVPCSGDQIGYCKNSTHYSFWRPKSLNDDFELTFCSFGVPGRQGTARDEFAAALKSNCSTCQIYIKDRSIWGFRKDGTGWKQF